MKTPAVSLDKTAIGLSLFCAIHCLLLPVALVMAPTLAASGFASEAFHQWLLIAVLPISVVALGLGCRRHHNFSTLRWGIPGLLILSFTALWGHDLLGETGEKLASLLGASLIAVGHWINHRLCQQQNCPCGNER